MEGISTVFYSWYETGDSSAEENLDEATDDLDNSWMDTPESSTENDRNICASEICDICSKAFKTKRLLQKHKIIHFILPSPCETCNKTFSSKVNLQKHISRVHSIKFLSSSTCDKVFTASRQLK